ncbi:tautomerase family protein [Sphingobacterium detergens]|nr:tautomerase family protein [Sphingobacterium detergens]
MKSKLITMPLVRITLSENYDINTQDLISNSVHRALMDEFQIPKDDFFHIIESVSSPQLRFPQEYLDIKHTKDIVYIQITAAIGRDVNKKRKLYRQISLNISNSTPINPQDVIIVLLENSKHDWSFGNGEMQTFNHV